MLKAFFFILVIFTSTFLYSQDYQKIDSLKNEIEKGKKDTFLALKDLTLIYINSRDIENTKIYSKIALQYALKKKNNSYIASAKILDSWNYTFQSDFENALKKLEEGFVFAKASNDLQAQINIRLNKITIFTIRTDYKNVILESEEILQIIDQKDEKYRTKLIALHLQRAIAYSELGLFEFAKGEIINLKKVVNNERFYIPQIYSNEYFLYGKMKDYEKAIAICKKIILFVNEDDFEGKEAWLLNTYYNMAEYYNALGDLDNSNHYLNLALSQKDNNHFYTNFNSLRPYFYNLKSKNLDQKKLYEKAHLYSDSAFLFSKENGDTKMIAGSISQKARIFFHQKEYSKSILNNLSAKKIFHEADHKPDEMAVTEELIDLYLLTDQNLKASEMFKDYLELRDVLFNEQVANSISAAEIKYQTELKESKIKTQELQIQKEKTNKYISYGGVVFLILLSSAVYFWFRNKNMQQKLEIQNRLLSLQFDLNKMELQSLNTQLDPHEIKNLLASISPEIQEKAPESYRKMLKLLNITKASLNNSSMTESLKNQIRQLEDYLSLEKNNLSVPFEYFIENKIENNDVQIPRLMLKNLVENSIKHGIKGNKSGGKINVMLQQENNFYSIIVDDTGKGRNLSTVSDSGIGISTYRNLFATLNKKNTDNAVFQIIDKEKGTRVEVKIPTEYLYQ